MLEIAEIVDVAFIVFVSAACFISLNRDASGIEESAHRWREELHALQNVLRALIEEASTASNSLDRRLLKRKQELEQILIAAEKKVEEKTLNISASKQPVVASSNLAPIEPPWAKEKPQVKSPQKQASLLNEQLEILKEKEERHTFEKLNIVDPTTYRIARRLLSAGHEIHVVARKLELPLAEVRMLDRLMREEKQIDMAVTSVQTKEIKQNDFIKAEFSGEKPAPRSLAQQIERETALL